MILKGIHHVSAHTANAADNYDFYTRILGMRLVKKAVKDLTFFGIPMLAKTHKGTNSISDTSLRVPTDEALQYWQKRFLQYDVKHGEITERAGHQILRFEDPEGQRLTLISDEKDNG